MALILLVSCAKNVTVQVPSTPEQKAVVYLGIVESSNAALAESVIEAEKLKLIAWDDAKPVLTYSREVAAACVDIAGILRPANTATWAQKKVLIAASVGNRAPPVVVAKLLASTDPKVQAIGVAIQSVSTTLALLARGAL